ncbi:uncharacterized protein LOC126796159 [Argentina anserina]|uniref:uncharacterized protein LOC126796159 n=1 Tax=Argentina anserina TaxID=57926 RepID=UPI0021766BFF|nr:uncharacterized protein LOC126796159 [Potentilla anserina]
MGLFKKLSVFLGLAKDDDHEVKDKEEEDDDSHPRSNQAHFRDTGLPRKGFSVPVQVAVDRPLPGPILIPCRSGDGGVQGLRWHAKRLRIDEDGDVADEFLEEVFPDMSASRESRRFEVKSGTRPAKVKSQAISQDGRIQQRVEYRGRSVWI